MSRTAICPHRRQHLLALALLTLGIVWLTRALAETLLLPPEDVDLVGVVRTVAAQHEDTLLDIARRFHLGHDEIVIANPEVDRWLPGEGTPITLPTRYILPNAKRTGLVLNVPEMRLYYFPPATPGETPLVQTYPVSVGRMDWSTPLGQARVAAKQTDPSWHPPKSIREEAAAKGDPLPEIVPPGPKNPLGKFALRLSVPGYLIHGTDKPWGIGMRVTHGCLRLYPEDIETLYQEVPVGTRVQIVNQPVKVGWLAGTLFMEVHPPLEEDTAGRAALMNTALGVLEQALQRDPVPISGQAVNRAVTEQRGLPVPISLNATPQK